MTWVIHIQRLCVTQKVKNFLSYVKKSNGRLFVIKIADNHEDSTREWAGDSRWHKRILKASRVTSTRVNGAASVKPNEAKTATLPFHFSS